MHPQMNRPGRDALTCSNGMHSAKQRDSRISAVWDALGRRLCIPRRHWLHVYSRLCQIQEFVDDLGARAAAELEAAMVEAETVTQHILASLGDDPAKLVRVWARA